jgi:hypothetical protein
MKTIIIVLLLLIGIILVIPLLLQQQQVIAQTSALEQMMSHMRFTHSQLTNNIDDVIQLIETNNTSEALTLLQGMDVKIGHMNTMFNDLVWEISNKGH